MKVVHRAVVLIGNWQRTENRNIQRVAFGLTVMTDGVPLSRYLVYGTRRKLRSTILARRGKKIWHGVPFTRNTIICSIACCQKISIVPLRWCSVEEFRGAFLFRTSLTANIQGRDNTTTTPTLWKNMTMPWIQTYIHKTLTHKKHA